jgi:MoaA/NifB/PqqE/SkfB family radical SAM enzyme
MCYYSDKEYAKRIRGRFNDEDLDRIGALFFSNALQLVIGCGSEPTLYKGYPEIVRSAKESGVPFVGLTTNGLLLKRSDLRHLINYGLDEITLSVHGVTESTYHSMMVGGSYSVFHEALAMLEEEKSVCQSRKPDLRINYTVNEENLDELRDFFSVFGIYSISTLQIRPMVDVGHASYSYKPLDEEALARYHSVLSTLSGECKKNGVTLLATKHDPNFKKSDHQTSYALPAVLRHIHPNKVWMTDFRWREESYRDYCRRSGWRKTLFLSAFNRAEYFKETKHTLTYDVEL